jgi:hypothetical protein
MTSEGTKRDMCEAEAASMKEVSHHLFITIFIKRCTFTSEEK